MYGQPEGERWRVSAGPILTLPIVLVTTVRPIHIHTVLHGNEVRVSTAVTITLVVAH